MKDIKEKAYAILDISTKIYQINEISNPNAIFKDNIFKVLEDGKIIKEKDFERKYSSYYFQSSEINGVIIKKENGNYSVKGCVKYKYFNGDGIWFAKIRIENSSNEILIKGKRCGSLESEDWDDEDLIKNPSEDFLMALNEMLNHLKNIYNQLCENNGLNCDLYEPEWVKKLKYYNK